MLFWVMMSQRYFNVCPCKTVFLFYFSVWMSSIALSSIMLEWSLTHSSTSSNLLLSPLQWFFSSVINSVLEFLCFFLVQFLTVFLHYSLKFIEYLYDHYFECFIKWIAYHCFYFSEVLFCCFNWNSFCCLLICLIFCVCLYVLSKSVISPILEGVGLLRRYTLWIRSAVPCGPQRQVLRVLYVGWMHPPVVLELQLVLRHAGE